jgi:hypothetical protein
MKPQLPHFVWFWWVVVILVVGGFATWKSGRVDYRGEEPISRAKYPDLFRQVAIAWVLITFAAITIAIYATFGDPF